MNAFLKDNVVIGLSATTFNGSEMDGYIQICAEVIFGVLMKNITVSFMPLETGEGECHHLTIKPVFSSDVIKKLCHSILYPVRHFNVVSSNLGVVVVVE